MSWLEDWTNGRATINPLAIAWRSLPQNVRDTYTSGFNALVDMSTPAAVRDYTNSAQDTARSAVEGDGWGTATNALATVNAALGAIPVAGMGVRLAQKGARDVGKVVGKEADNFIRAYHGSPHSFDKFDLSKIGTGEGAQAYGHGLYFAENERIAKGYRDTLSAPTGNKWQDVAGRVWNATGGNRERAIAELQARVDNLNHRRSVNPDSVPPDSVKPGSSDLEVALEQLKGGHTPGGHMYEVAIHADPEKFLDWDKPLSQQPIEIRNLIDTVSQGGMKGSKITPDSTGADLYHAMKSPDAARRFGYQNWSTTGPAEYLNNMEIPGIKYLDAGSRGAGEGSRNYVVFDANTIEILRKYGLLPVAAAAGYAGIPADDGAAQ